MWNYFKQYEREKQRRKERMDDHTIKWEKNHIGEKPMEKTWSKVKVEMLFKISHCTYEDSSQTMGNSYNFTGIWLRERWTLWKTVHQPGMTSQQHMPKGEAGNYILMGLELKEIHIYLIYNLQTLSY